MLVSFRTPGTDLRQIATAARQKHPQPADFVILWPGNSPGWRYLASRTGKTAFLIEMRRAEYDSVASQTQLLAGLVKQGAGRRVIDCEGYTYLSEQVLQ
ncbi:MAG: hypothetical protein FJW38_13010 [Acidobacteria bacterium]|nr:hypothetical protein [Acidobacteriota bacterium]